MTQAFGQYLCVHKGLMPVTVNGHVKAVERIYKQAGELTYEKAERYIFTLYQSSASYSHKVNQAKALEYWFEFQGQQVRFARQKKPKQIIKQTLSEGEVTSMFLCCTNIRERAILSVLSYSGVRPKELCRIKRGDINFGTHELTVVNGKGTKDRVVYISADSINILISYLANYPKNPDDFLFLTADGKRPYNAQCLRKFIHVLAGRAGIQKRAYPYLLRHSLAINMINRGCDIFTIKSQLGHGWIQTTLLYLNSLGYGLKNAYDKFVPSYC